MNWVWRWSLSGFSEYISILPIPGTPAARTSRLIAFISARYIMKSDFILPKAVDPRTGWQHDYYYNEMRNLECDCFTVAVDCKWNICTAGTKQIEGA